MTPIQATDVLFLCEAHFLDLQATHHFIGQRFIDVTRCIFYIFLMIAYDRKTAVRKMVENVA